MKLITGLILTLVLLLTGCSKAETAPEEFLYTAMYSRTADEITTPGIFHIEAGEFFTEVSVSTADRPNQVVFTDYTPDGNPVSSASFPLPEDAMQIPHAYLGERGVYLIHKGGFESDPYYLSLYDRAGTLMQSVPLKDVKPDMASSHYPNSDPSATVYQYTLPMAETEDGIVLLWDSYALFLDQTFAVTAEVKLPTAKASLWDDNGPKIVYSTGGKASLASVTPDGITDSASLPERFCTGTILDVKDGIVYGTDKAAVYLYDTAGEGKNLPEDFCTLTPSGINGMQIRKLLLVHREDTVCPDLHVFHSTLNEYRYTLMTKDTSNLLGDRVTVTVAVREPDRTLAQHIIDFNQSQSEIRVVLVDYSVYESSDNPGGAWKKLRMDLETGILKPDIIASYSTFTMEFLQGMDDGYFADIRQLMAEYPSCGVTEDDVWNSVLTAYSKDGKLLAIPKSFRMQTVVGLSKYLPGESWTMEEFLDYAQSLPDGVYPTDAMSRDSLYSLLGGYQYDSFTAQKKFDNPLYIRYLNYLKSLPATAPTLVDQQTAYDPLIGENVNVTTDPYAIYRDGTARLAPSTLLFPASYLEIMTQFGADSPDDLTFIGYPTGHDGELHGGHAVSSTECVYMIPSHCANREEAWSFVTYVIRGYGESLKNMTTRSRAGIGILKSATMEYLNQLEVYETRDKAGNVTGLEAAAEGENEQPALTAAVREGFAALYDTPAYPYLFLRTPYDLEEIIHEEENAFLAGSGTAESTAKSVQSRAGIYLAEHQ